MTVRCVAGLLGGAKQTLPDRQTLTKTTRNQHETNTSKHVFTSGVVDETSGRRCQVVAGPLRLATDDRHKRRRPSIFRIQKQSLVVVDGRNNSAAYSGPLLARSHGIVIQHDVNIIILPWKALYIVF